MSPYISVIPQVEALLATYRNSSVLLGTILLLTSSNYVRLYDNKPGKSTCWYRYHSEKIAWETCFAATEHPFPGIEPPEGNQMSFAEATAPASAPESAPESAPASTENDPPLSDEHFNDTASMYSLGFNASQIDLSQTASSSRSGSISTTASRGTERGSVRAMILGNSSAKKHLGRTKSRRVRQPRPRDTRDLWGKSWSVMTGIPWRN